MTESLRGPFRQNASESTSTPSPAIPRSERAALVMEKIATHFEIHRQSWENASYRKLLLKDAPGLSFQPFGMKEDRSNRLMRAAKYLVQQNQKARVDRVQSIIDKRRNQNNDLGR